MLNVDEEVAWWDINSKEDDCFKDTNDYGYVATKLSHLPRVIGYDFGNVIMYRTLRGNEEGARLYDLKRSNLSGVNVIRKLINETSELPFNLCSDSVAIVQCDVLHDPSVYIINRKSVLVNKPYVYYNKDSSNVHCAPLSTNVLKWSEGFLGDCMTIEPVCRYEEPIRNVVLNTDYPKISMFEHNGVVYDSVGYPSFSDYRTEVKFENFPSSSRINPKVNWCINAISCIGVPLHFSSTILPRSAVTNESDAISMSIEWFYEDNISLMMKNGETFSVVGALGSCRNYTNDSLRTVMKIAQRLIDNISCESNSITFNNIIAHHTSEIVKHRMQNGNLIFPILPGDLESGIFDNCPYKCNKGPYKMLEFY